MADLAIETDGLTRRFGRTIAVQAVDLRVPVGSVYGYLGRNGAGKTTTIEMLMGLLSPSSGQLSVLGLDPFREDVAMKLLVSYVPERISLPESMTMADLMAFGAGMHPNWDRTLAEELRLRLELPSDRRIGRLSRGMQGKAALLLALAPRPKLLILDDPTLGLDVVVRREFMESIVAALSDLGTTVFFSSHLLGDVERVADQIGIIHEGRLLVQAPLEELQESVRRVIATFPEGPGTADSLPAAELLPDTLQYRRDGRQHLYTVRHYGQSVLQRLHDAGALSAYVERCSLEDIFVALVREGAGDGAAP